MTLRPAPSMEGRVGSRCNSQIALSDYIFKTLPGCINLNLMNGLALVVHLMEKTRAGLVVWMVLGRGCGKIKIRKHTRKNGQLQQSASENFQML